MLVGGVVVEDDVDRLVGGNLALDSVEKADEFDVAVALHAAVQRRTARWRRGIAAELARCVDL